jgi:hypothetical protein
MAERSPVNHSRLAKSLTYKAASRPLDQPRDIMAALIAIASSNAHWKGNMV